MKINDVLFEFAPSGDSSGSGDYFQALASAWYNGTFDTGSLQKGIKSQQDVEQLLNRGIIGPDGVTRKYGIDYNSTFDGVVISSDDYYEHADHDETDSRTGKPFGPYDYMEFGDEELDESAKYRDPKYKDQLYTQEPPDYNNTREYDNARFNPKPKGYPGRKKLPGGGEYDRTDPLVRGAGIGRSGIKNNINLSGKRKGLPSRDQITSLKQSIRDISGQHTRANLPEQDIAEEYTRGAWKDEALDYKDFADLAYEKLTGAYGDKRRGIAQHYSRLENRTFGSAINQHGYTQLLIDLYKKANRDFTNPQDDTDTLSGTGFGHVSQREQGMAEDSLNEFAPSSSDDGDDGFDDETLKRLAAQWWNGDEDPRIEQTLAAAGWEIGQDEGYEDEPGVFVVQAGDVNGNSYISWPADELRQDMAEGDLNELSTEKLAQYKTAAGADARKADAGGDYARGDKRFKGINQATNKQFDNDLKKHGQQDVAEGTDYQDMVSRVKQLAGMGPLNTVSNPDQRVYKNMPTAVQPKKEQR